VAEKVSSIKSIHHPLIAGDRATAEMNFNIPYFLPLTRSFDPYDSNPNSQATAIERRKDAMNRVSSRCYRSRAA
jgi:hypothetical protein